MKFVLFLVHLVGKQGKVESIDHEKEEASVLIDFLGNQNLMEIGLVQLEKVEL